MQIEMIKIFLFVGIIKLKNACEEVNCPSCVRDCQDVQDLGFTKSGVYHVTPTGTHDGLDVYCDMERDGGGWLVFQRRGNGTVNFDRKWNDYENGFGDISGEYWIGNIFLHIMTSRFDYQLRVDLQDWEGNIAYAKYKIFKIGSVNEKYSLGVSGYSGDAGDTLKDHSGVRFATNDDYAKGCVKNLMSGWWFINCHDANLNGNYKHPAKQLAEKRFDKNVGIQWQKWKGNKYSLKTTEMKMKRL